jgi:hypothetical protein
VVNGTTVYVADSLPEALLAATGATTGGEQPPPPDGEGTVEDQLRRLLAEATDHFAAAQEALQNGDLADYQSELEQARALVEQASELAARGGGTEPSPSP